MPFIGSAGKFTFGQVQKDIDYANVPDRNGDLREVIHLCIGIGYGWLMTRTYDQAGPVNEPGVGELDAFDHGSGLLPPELRGPLQPLIGGHLYYLGVPVDMPLGYLVDFTRQSSIVRTLHHPNQPRLPLRYVPHKRKHPEEDSVPIPGRTRVIYYRIRYGAQVQRWRAADDI